MSGKQQYYDWGIRSELNLEFCIKHNRPLVRTYIDAVVSFS
jgi:hypothetical protein